MTTNITNNNTTSIKGKNMNTNILDKYIKQEAQKDIIAEFNMLAELALDSNRNKEYWDEFNKARQEALDKNIHGDELQALLTPFINALDNDNLASPISKEEKERESNIWNNKDLIVKREAMKSTLHYMIKKFILHARNNNANNKFIELIRKKQQEAYKLAFDIEAINTMLISLESKLHDTEYQLNSNQKITKEKFDNIIKHLHESCKQEHITINQYNSGEYNNEDSSLWSEIFNLKNEAINQDVKQAIVECIIADINKKIHNTIRKITLSRDIKEQKNLIQRQLKDDYIAKLTPRQKEIRERFLTFQQAFIGKCNKEFWDILFNKRRIAIDNEYNDNKINEICNDLEDIALKHIKE